MLLKSSSCCFPQFHVESVFKNLRRLSVLSDSLGSNFARYRSAPRNDFSCFWLSGCFNSSIAFTFSLFGLIPVSSISWPSHLVLFKKNSDFLSLARYPAFFNFPNISNNLFSCSFWSPRVTTIMSSSYAGVEYTSVRSIFSWNIGETVESLFESVVSAKISSRYCKNALSARFF